MILLLFIIIVVVVCVVVVIIVIISATPAPPLDPEALIEQQEDSKYNDLIFVYLLHGGS